VRFRKGDTIEIKWTDAYSPSQNGWKFEEDYIGESTENLFEITSIGYLLHKDRNYITLSACHSDRNSEFRCIVNRLIRIPLGCINSVTLMKATKAKKK
jgi:hypothetical protein